MTDVFAYSAPMRRGQDLEFIKTVSDLQDSEELILILTTNGGDPDAAYKIGRYLQHKYPSFKILIPGLCKSAGTLLAIAAEEIIFSPYGELGPLDIQMSKTDDIAGMESGLNISEAFTSLESRARETYHNLVMEIINSSGGVISFHTASHSASEIVSAIYSPVFSKIDPEEVGSRTRAMRIGEDYGLRLNMKHKNLRVDKLSMLSQSYSSHGFVIDMLEARVLFNNVREATEVEKSIVDMLGETGRISGNSTFFKNLSAEYAKLRETQADDDTPNCNASPDSESSTTRSNGKNPQGASSASAPKTSKGDTKAK
ncbi:SDH family Clp fold serine proteinase [Tritonibacter mobilis]|uniref:SDH family Clp fold serine proteinase n=1 Tax=Tritonibacter mobilis TaxID=379347 RepID=UPI000806AD53|nr:hypothetical protein [Tritonibacter mobilis]GLP86271.1 hypothetical protein GCM10007921_18310 [Tritonibacter mobilis]SDX17332.1 Serine dehydrogenase proteinase [Tritonibacter mobilis]